MQKSSPAGLAFSVGGHALPQDMRIDQDLCPAGSSKPRLAMELGEFEDDSLSHLPDAEISAMPRHPIVCKRNAKNLHHISLRNSQAWRNADIPTIIQKL
ncbi:hypothetical protein E4U51_002488 [Claviceps purpurea]|nr:hypothetical protein E4U51_002488 [Claviceps purpurea]